MSDSEAMQEMIQTPTVRVPILASLWIAATSLIGALYFSVHWCATSDFYSQGQLALCRSQETLLPDYVQGLAGTAVAGLVTVWWERAATGGNTRFATGLACFLPIGMFLVLRVIVGGSEI